MTLALSGIHKANLNMDHIKAVLTLLIGSYSCFLRQVAAVTKLLTPLANNYMHTSSLPTDLMMQMKQASNSKTPCVDFSKLVLSQK